MTNIPESYRQFGPEAAEIMWKQHQAISRLERENEALGLIRCPDGEMHVWDGDGQCRNCCNYATDLIDKALRGEGEK